MDTYSRSKKNEQIHNQMENNRETDLSSPKLNEYARRLNAIDTKNRIIQLFIQINYFSKITN